MEIKEALKLALQSIWANKMRSILTVLGVVISVASVIAVITLVNGAKTFVSTKMDRYGGDVFTVSKQAQNIRSYADYQMYQKRKDIRLDDYRYVADNCQRCVLVGAMQTSLGKVVSGTQSSTDTQIRGYTWTMPQLQNLNIVQGRGFTESEEQHASQVAIIGTDIEENVLGPGDPVGKEIRVDGVPYTIIGLGEKQGKTLGQSQDNWVAVPITSYQKTYGAQKTLTIYAKGGGPGEALDLATDDMRSLMRARRHDAPGQPDSFQLDTSSTFASFFQTIANSFGAVALAMAAISLVVGGIVIMNIMLVSVTERTREIGIRKALGARQGDILSQFLMESATLALGGGLLGVMMGVGVAEGVTVVLGFPSSVALWSVLLGLIVAIGVGLFFGVYPARKAAMLDPIVALRAE